MKNLWSFTYSCCSETGFFSLSIKWKSAKLFGCNVLQIILVCVLQNKGSHGTKWWTIPFNSVFLPYLFAFLEYCFSLSSCLLVWSLPLFPVFSVFAPHALLGGIMFLELWFNPVSSVSLLFQPTNVTYDAAFRLRNGHSHSGAFPLHGTVRYGSARYDSVRVGCISTAV